MSAQAFQYNKDYRRCELCYEYWPKVPSKYFPEGRRECLNCQPGDETHYYYTVCGKCGANWWCKYNVNPWICSNCQKTPEEREKLAKMQVFSSEIRVGMGRSKLKLIPQYVLDEAPTEWELRKFHKSGRTLEKQAKKDYSKIKKRMAWAARKARLAGVPTNYTWKGWMAKVDFYGWRCVYCNLELTMQPKQKNRLTCDHFKALKNGGTHYLSNLFPACKSCNSKKWKHKHWKIKFRPKTVRAIPCCPVS
jgi:5-methylcytosine-specific restriction endonuclease McrA